MNSSSINKPTQWFVGVVSVVVPLLVAYLLFADLGLASEQGWVYSLPGLNAVINSATAILLLLGLYFIKKGDIVKHKTMMLAALALGVIFLVSYLIYHSSVTSTVFGGEGAIKYVYYFLLISHIVLSVVEVPLVLLALIFAFTKRYDKHKRIVRWAYPVWLYVSVTGVIVYLLISPYYSF
ncbi:DUF420 domain-containing protein [Marinigracilibium pacificum]|uniref:DUF420 domain-containing protein n=1 Tax=Marinigracilibium pacificum TaxID=2729599 RepID=A0A848J336_9BACT|nr:DUF420 domain-containing protein [Marinigracilibium pacificum]NMM50166.1 DUF420 domain-containing protein [Marinigracilibium pacificum]